MTYSGYPTPDIDPNQHFVNVCITIPSSLGDVFYAVLLGQISEMANSYYWKKDGTMSPDACAYLWSQTLALTPANLEECGTVTCEQVADCINNDATTQQSLTQFLSNSGIVPSGGDNQPVPISPAQSSEQLLPSTYTCDNDHLFGMSRWIVQQLDASTRQMLAALEVATNQVELAAVLADNVEIVSWFDSGLEIAAWVQDQLIEWYAAAYTPTVEDTLACEIFCLIKDDCLLTIDKIIDAYSNNSFGVPTDANDLLSVLAWLFGTTFDGSIGTVATYHYFIAQALRYGTTLPLLGGLRLLKVIVQMGEDETDADWNILCSCVTPDLCDNYKASQGNITIVGGNGTYQAGLGWASVDVGSTVRMTLERNYGTPQNIDSVTVTFDSIGLTYAGIQRQLQIYDPDLAQIVATFDISQLLGTQTDVQFVYSTPFTASRFWIWFDVNPSADGTVYLTEMCVDPQGA